MTRIQRVALLAREALDSDARPVPNDPAVSARLIVPTDRLAAGSTTEATIRLRNKSGRPIKVETCGTPFQVALSSASVKPAVERFPLGLGPTLTSTARAVSGESSMMSAAELVR